MPSKRRIFLIIFYLSILLPKGQLFAQLRGVYTIDSGKQATSSNYKSIIAAVNDLNYGTRTDNGAPNGKGISGAVTFNIADGIYAGQFIMGQIIGANSANTIVFQSASGDSSKAILVDSAAGGSSNYNYLVRLNATSYVYFRKLSFIRPNGGNVIYLASPSHIHFENCIIAENDNYSSNVYDMDQHSEYDSFVNNVFKNAGNGLNISNLNGDTDSYIVINNNVFQNVVNPITCRKQTNLTITANTISGNFKQSSTGIELLNIKGPAFIENNIINIQDTSSLTGIYLQVINTYFSTNGAFYDTAKVLVANNMILLVDHSVKSNVFGLEIEADNFTDIVYNTVVIDSSSSPNSFPLDFDLAGDTDKILDNDFVNISGKYAALLNNSFSVTTDTLNYNNFYSGPGLISWVPVMGKDTDINILKSLKVIDPKDNDNISVLPLFKSESDLHTVNFVLHGKGIPFASVRDDIDGKLRDKKHPDIGANELNVKHDLGIYSIQLQQAAICNGMTTFDSAIITVTNFGIDTEKNIAFYYKIPDLADSGLAYTDSVRINPGFTDSIKIPLNLSVKDSGRYKILVYFKLDSNQNVNNDTISTYVTVISAPRPAFTYSLACVDNPVSFKITTKSYKALNYYWYFGDGDSAYVKDTSHTFILDTTYTTILKSIDSVGCTDTFSLLIKPLPISYSTFSYQVAGPSYTFIPDDSGFKNYKWNFGDGDTSALFKTSHTYSHNGIYPVTLYVQNANGCYDSLPELIDIIDAGILTQNQAIQHFSVYPNPFNNQAEIKYQLLGPGLVQILLYNETGQEVGEIMNENELEGSYSQFIDPKEFNLKPGIYYLQISTSATQETIKLIYLK